MGGVRRALITSIRSVAPSIFSGSSKSLGSLPTPVFTSVRRGNLSSRICRLPVELGCVQSLMPLHSATASALMSSMLGLKPGSWGWVSEGFATPL